MSVEDDAEAWILRALFGGLALCALVAVVAFTIWKVRSAMMDDDDRSSCRRGGGDVILIARDAFNGNEASWRCVRSASFVPFAGSAGGSR